MITYGNEFWGFSMLLRIHGSALWKSILPAFISTCIYVLLIQTDICVAEGSDYVSVFLHPYPMQALVTAFTFLLVFRANYSYNRWWDAYSSVYMMHSKWLDFATEVSAFHYQSKRYDRYKPPSFGANPGVQSLEVRESEIVVLNDYNNYDDDDHDERGFVPTSSVGAGGNVIGIELGIPVPKTTEAKAKERVTMKKKTRDGSYANTNTNAKVSPTTKKKKQHFRHSSAVPPQGLPRHAKTPTLIDLVEQMDACEAREAEMNRQSLDGDLLSESIRRARNEIMDDDDDDNSVRIPVSGDDVNNGEEEESGNVSASRRSWFSKRRVLNNSGRKIRDRLRKVVSNSSNNSNNKQGMRGLDNKKSNNPPPTGNNTAARMFNRRKSITTPLHSNEEEIEFRDRYDVKTGKQYSVFTAFSRKHLRDGNLDPDIVPPLLFLEECAHLLSLMSAVAFSTLRNDLPEAESPLTVFEPGLPWPLVDPDGYKARVRKGWTQSKSRLYSELQFLLGRSRNDHARTLYNAARPFRVIGNVSDAEIEKLQEARGPLAKVSLVSMWLLELISREYQAGSTGKVAPPIISRLYQFISDGLSGYNQARKVSSVPFPFPHAQITTVFMIVVDFFVTPLLMTTYVLNPWLGAVLNLFSVLCFTGLHEVAREIENPFQNVPNDVPLNNYQAQFNEGLMIMFYGYHPDAFWKKNNNNNNSEYNNHDDGVGYNNNNNNQGSDINEPIIDDGRNEKSKYNIIAGTVSSTNEKGFGSEEDQHRNRLSGKSISNNSKVSFSIPTTNRVGISAPNKDEATPESVNVERAGDLPKGKSLCLQDVFSMAVSSPAAGDNESDFVVSSNTTKQSFFRVPMGSKVNSSSSSFRGDVVSSKIEPSKDDPSSNNNNDSIRFINSSNTSSNQFFQTPPPSNAFTALFQVPNSDLDSSAVFETDIIHNEGKK